MSTDKNALCKAMGTLFLQHRVQCLESDVRKMRGSSELADTNGESSSRCPLVRSWTRGWSTPAAPPPPQPEPKAPTGATRVIVVDASVLIYSMRSVHEWRKRGDVRVIVPDEAICTLDVLKKGDQRINLAARKAARYIEDHLVCDLKQAQLYLPGLRPQMDDQKLPLSMASYIRLSQATDDQDFSVSHELTSAPVNIRETVLGALWYQQALAPKEGVRLTIAVAFPPAEGGSDSDSASPYEQRVDGRLVVPWLRAYGFREKRDDADQLYSIEVVPTASSWLQGDREAGEKTRTRGMHDDRHGHHDRGRGHERREEGRQRHPRHEDAESRRHQDDRRHRRHEEEYSRRGHDDRGLEASRHGGRETMRRGHDRRETRHPGHDTEPSRHREHRDRHNEHRHDDHREHDGRRHHGEHSERHHHARHGSRSDKEDRMRDPRGGRHHHHHLRQNDDMPNTSSDDARAKLNHHHNASSVSSSSDSGSASDEVILVEQAVKA